MTDELKLARAVNRQAQAEALMRNEMLQEAFAYLENVFVDEWRQCVDPALRDELWRSQASVTNLRGHLKKVIANGKLAQAEIDQLTERKKRLG